MKKKFSVLALGLVICQVSAAWSPAGDKMMTRWGKEVTPQNAWREYPRPQLTRPAWSNLNGLWEYAITPAAQSAKPASWDGEILVPFCVESSLSGVGRSLQPDQKLWYRTSFEVDPAWKGKDLILHFGAVDWACEVWVNGRRAGEHRGGFDAFSFNVAKLLKPKGKQELVVAVTDPSSTDAQARGKQHLQPQGIWYTPVSGIWQTVWIEPVPTAHIRGVVPRAEIDTKNVTIKTDLAGTTGRERIALRVYDASGDLLTREFAVSEPVAFTLPGAELWSPANPKLYRFEMTLLSNGREIDRIGSYFALREVSKTHDAFGRSRMALNGEIVFHYGTLDQGWWPDGLHTPPSAQAMRYDMEVLKDLGFNTIRKHIKVEPALYYYYADSMGVLLWQDMPSGFPVQERDKAHVAFNAKNDWNRPAESARQWEKELKTMIDNLDFFPSIVTWVVFNEGWGQYETPRVVDWTMKYDPSRLINGVSGWTDRKVGDMYDVHNYPCTAMTPMSTIQGRIQVLGEFGGLGLALPDHLWNPGMRNWGYRNMDDNITLLNDYARLMYDLESLIAMGLSGAIYTQTTDVEGEVNGLITYDRERIKIPKQYARMLHHRLYTVEPAAEKMLVSDSRVVANSKSVAVGGGETKNVKMPVAIEPGQTIRSSSSFDLDRIPDGLSLQLMMRNKVRVWLNGKPVADLPDARLTRSYNQYNLSDYTDFLHLGTNVLEVENVNDDKKSDFDYCLYSY